MVFGNEIDLEFLSIIPEHERLPVSHFINELIETGDLYEDINDVARHRRDSYYFVKGAIVYSVLEDAVKEAKNEKKELTPEHLIQFSKACREKALSMTSEGVEHVWEEISLSLVSSNPILRRMTFKDFHDALDKWTK